MSKLSYTLARLTVRIVEKINRTYSRINQHRLTAEFRHLGSHALIESPISVMNPGCMSIGDHFIARSGVKIRAYTEFIGMQFQPSITFGDHVHLAADVTINCLESITIGNHSGIGVGSSIMDHMHGLPNYEDLHIPVMQRVLTSRGGVTIGDNVYVGTGVVILAGVEIGDNSIIGSNAVVTKSIPPNSIAAGVPAKVIKTLQPPRQPLQNQSPASTPVPKGKIHEPLRHHTVL